MQHLEGYKPNGGQFAIDSPAAPLDGVELARDGYGDI
jgi:hypothetical protein